MPLPRQLLIGLCTAASKQHVPAVTDLVVVTLLRLNAAATKETLCKALFNLLARVEIREMLVNGIDLLSAMVELSKINSLSLLELVVRVFFNLSCELRTGSGVEEVYASKVCGRG